MQRTLENARATEGARVGRKAIQLHNNYEYHYKFWQEIYSPRSPIITFIICYGQVDQFHIGSVSTAQLIGFYHLFLCLSCTIVFQSWPETVECGWSVLKMGFS